MHMLHHLIVVLIPKWGFGIVFVFAQSWCMLMVVNTQVIIKMRTDLSHKKEKVPNPSCIVNTNGSMPNPCFLSAHWVNE